jgi:hypothetical protein
MHTVLCPGCVLESQERAYRDNFAPPASSPRWSRGRSFLRRSASCCYILAAPAFFAFPSLAHLPVVKLYNSHLPPLVRRKGNAGCSSNQIRPFIPVLSFTMFTDPAWYSSFLRFLWAIPRIAKNAIINCRPLQMWKMEGPLILVLLGSVASLLFSLVLNMYKHW